MYAGKGEMTVETEYLNILPNQDLVRTDSPVVIKQAPKTVIYATGMVYEKDKKLSPYCIEYVPIMKNQGANVTQAPTKKMATQPQASAVKAKAIVIKVHPSKI